MGWYRNSGEVKPNGDPADAGDLSIFPLMRTVQKFTGNDATYTPPAGLPAPNDIPRNIRGVIEQASESGFRIDELDDQVGYITTDERFRVMRADGDIDRYPRDPTGEHFGRITTAGQTFDVVGVAVTKPSFIYLSLSGPVAV